MSSEGANSDSQLILRMPSLDLPGVSVYASAWLKRCGWEVMKGERLLELVAGEVTIDLPAPARGILVRRLVEEDQEVRPGQPLALLACR